MNDGYGRAPAEESHEFEDVENAQSSQHSTPTQDPQTQVSPPQQDQQQQKPENPLDVKDQVGKFMETAAASIFGSTDPAQIAQDEQEKAQKENQDKVKAANIKQFLNQMAEDEARLRAQRQEEAQKKMEEQQEEEVEDQKEEMKKQEKEQSFQQQHILAEQSKAERKGGVGG